MEIFYDENIEQYEYECIEGILKLSKDSYYKYKERIISAFFYDIQQINFSEKNIKEIEETLYSINNKDSYMYIYFANVKVGYFNFDTDNFSIRYKINETIDNDKVISLKQIKENSYMYKTIYAIINSLEKDREDIKGYILNREEKNSYCNIIKGCGFLANTKEFRGKIPVI